MRAALLLLLTVAPATVAASATNPSPIPLTAEAPAAVAPQTDDDSFDLRMRTMEDQVKDLGEKVFRSKARLLLMHETRIPCRAIRGIMEPSVGVLVHRNELGSRFQLESAAYWLDGAPLFMRVDASGELDEKKEFELFNGRIAPGPHQLTVKLNLRGRDFGVFGYLQGYRFEVRSAYAFDAEPGTTTLKIVGYEKGSILLDELQDRPAVRFELERPR